MKFIKMLLLVAAAGLLALLSVGTAEAQCAMCKAVIENSSNAAEASRSLNLAALVLLVPPVTLFSGLFVAIYRFRNVQGRASTNDQADAMPAAQRSRHDSNGLT